MFCKKCGKEVADDTRFCPFCGTQLSGEETEKPVVDPTPRVVENETKVKSNDDSGSAGWGVLGFFFPIVGFILWLVWKKEKPNSSRAAGIGTLVSVILSVILFILWIVLIVIGVVAAGQIYESQMGFYL